jgi:hypothetical protein
VLGLFARKRPAKPASLRTRKREVWLRTDAFLQRDGIGDANPESVARTLRAFEHLVPEDYSDQWIELVGILDIHITPTFPNDGSRNRAADSPNVSDTPSFAA